MKVTMPQLGDDVTDGTIGRWLKQPGDHVAAGEPLLEVTTDKVNAEVPSPIDGVLTEILAKEGATVPKHAEIAVINEAFATVPNARANVTTAPAASVAATSGPHPTSEAPGGLTSSVPGAFTSAGSKVPADDDPRVRMTPAVRRLLREHGLSAAQMRETGAGGRITREDVLGVLGALRTKSAASAPSSTAPATRATTAAPTTPWASVPAEPGIAGVVFPDGANEVLVPMTRMRKGIAVQMTRALAVPHAYVHLEVDVSALVRARETAKRAFQSREGTSLSFVPFVIKATVDALRCYPAFNAHWSDAGLVAKRRIHMGVAVAVDGGLIGPVVRDVDQLSVSGLNRAIVDVAARARAGKLKLDDYGGSTFTIDNTGWFGSNLTMPIINVPEVAILTMEAITKRPVVRETPEGDVIAIRSIMNMVLAIDHRANDGAQAAVFLRAIKGWLEGIGPDVTLY